jgi:hypothetical protein
VSGDRAVFIVHNPYRDTVPDVELERILNGLASARAEDVQSRFGSEEYPRNSMGFVVFDPTAPASASSDTAVLAILAVGPTGLDYVPRALAKAISHRDYGVDCGVLVHTLKHRLPDDAFRFGFSVDIDGTIVGASGQTELQDRYQATLLAAEFNYQIHRAREQWEDRRGPGRWYSSEERISPRVTRILDPILAGADGEAVARGV